MTISITERELKKLVNTALVGVLNDLGLKKKEKRLNSPSARHLIIK